ncbi:MAG: PilN domain-containing protein, partial [Candidatus Aminicenantes bacterium]|nr:PilN domain-containing protein [Candidatus Aminicenantes bacterium]
MIRINLLKSDRAEAPKAAGISAPKIKEEKERKPLEFNYSLIFLLGIVAIAALFYTQNKAIKTEKELLGQAQQLKNQFRDVVTTLDQLEQQRALFEKKITLINTLKSRQTIAINILDQLSRTLPDWVWLTEASFAGDTVTVKGRAINNNLVAEYISNMEKSPCFRNVNVPSSTQKTTGNNVYYEFTITALYEKPM